MDQPVGDYIVTWRCETGEVKEKLSTFVLLGKNGGRRFLLTRRKFHIVEKPKPSNNVAKSELRNSRGEAMPRNLVLAERIIFPEYDSDSRVARPSQALCIPFPRSGISRVPCACNCARPSITSYIFSMGNTPPFAFASTVRSGGSFFRRAVSTPLPLASTPWQPMQPFSYSSLPRSVFCCAGAGALTMSAPTRTKILRTVSSLAPLRQIPDFSGGRIMQPSPL